MQSFDQEIKKLINQLSVSLQSVGINEPIVNKDDAKNLKKKLKKLAIDKDDNIQSAIGKTKKLIQEIYKNYENTAREFAKTSSLRATVIQSRADRDVAINQVKSSEFLRKQFDKRAEQTLKNAQEVQKTEQRKRKELIEELQNRILRIQAEYQASGKNKIEKYRENQTLKHEISKLQPQALTTQSLMDAQLKKKQIEIQIQMTTLKQKIQMMNNFKKMSEDTKIKLQAAEITSQKIEKRLNVLQSKQDENKIVVTRAHLVLQEYKKSIVKINQLLTKYEKQAIRAQQALFKKKQSMQQIEKKLTDLDKDYETQKNQIKILLDIQETLKKELAQ